jgi:hypothetical protein
VVTEEIDAKNGSNKKRPPPWKSCNNKVGSVENLLYFGQSTSTVTYPSVSKFKSFEIKASN